MSTVFEELVLRYGPAAGERGGELLVQEMFGADPDDWQFDGLRAFSRSERKISVRSGHGPGKTTLVAWFIWIQLLTRYPQKTVATAPTGGQLEGALLAEVVKWGTRLPPEIFSLYEVKTRGVYLKARPKESFFEARTSRPENPEAMQGVHCDPGYVLLIIDEASGVAEQVYESAIGSMSQQNAQTVLMGNPVRTSGTFFDSHHRLKSDYFTLWVGYWPDDATRPPGMFHSTRITEDYSNEVAKKYGEKSNAYRVRVLGEFPASDDDTVIPYELVAGAQIREITVPDALLVEVWGLDVARTGQDLNVLIRRTKFGVQPNIQWWGGMDLMYTAGRVKKLWDETTPSDRPQVILIDVIGLGAGVVDRLYELKLPVYGVNVAESAAYKDTYFRLRDQLWFEMRDWFSKLNVSLPTPTGEQDCPYERLSAELVTPRFTYQSSGKMKVESKHDMKKRGYDSPNFADALMLTFADEPATLMHGSESQRDFGGQYAWNEPLPKRNSRHG